MARCYYFVDSDGTECVSNVLPYRHSEGFWEVDENIDRNGIVELPPNTIYNLFNIHMSFKDNPICIEY